MVKLLVDTASGEQKLFEVDQTGSYSDPSLVLWDERSDGEFPADLVASVGSLVRGESGLAVNSERQAEHDAALAAEITAVNVQIKEEAIALLANVTGQPINLLQRAFALTVVKHLNLIRVAKGMTPIAPETFLDDLQTILGAL